MGSNDMQVNVAGIRRNIKNFAHNYSDAQKKVREATSNDHWGPSSTIMAEIADLTYNVVAFSEIMQMVWKRLNDHGKNWRHVYKALVLLEYLIKTGSEKVGQQCKENIYAIQTLKDFQHIEEGKDQGQNVREKAKQLVNLLKDDERLKNERARALKAKERFAQSASGFGSDGGLDTPTSPRYPAFRSSDWNESGESAELPRDIEIARPQTAGEEELQLQLALAMSREEAEQEEQKRKSDDVRLQLALSQSQQDFKKSQDKVHKSHLVDLLDVNLGGDPTPVDPWGMPQPPRPQQSSPWQSSSSPQHPPLGAPLSADPWQPASAPQLPPPAAPRADPWGLPAGGGAAAAAVANPLSSLSPVNKSAGTVKDPWSPTSPGSSTDMDEFDIITNRNRPTSPLKTNGNTATDPFELNLLGDALPPVPGSSPTTNVGSKKTPQSFLGENSALVNLDNLVTTTKPNNPALPANPFSDPAVPQPPPAVNRQIFNPQPPKPSINEIKQQSFAQFGAAAPPPQPTLAGFGAAPVFGTSSTTGQFSAAYPTNGAFNAPPSDPWTPVPSNTTLNGNGNVAAPWMKANEPPNPFLS
ncbi:epsin-2 isoform X2 [Anthonomus grandis grandis]|uniref:epsin-2 isoform X2 n=1 Tax=Anthonomus grandis grandis TaxID=2921223 RepID=UPI002165D9EB|nr:epsin-2 isoform X2 [Anthonomus grandis grandis]